MKASRFGQIVSTNKDEKYWYALSETVAVTKGPHDKDVGSTTPICIFPVEHHGAAALPLHAIVRHRLSR